MRSQIYKDKQYQNYKPSTTAYYDAKKTVSVYILYQKDNSESLYINNNGEQSNAIQRPFINVKFLEDIQIICAV